MRTSSIIIGLVVISESLAMFPPQITAPALLFPRNGLMVNDTVACSALSNLYQSCSAATPGFYALNPNLQVSCLCYTSSTLAPTVYDKALETCISFYETADPAFLTSVGIAQFSTLTAFGRTWTTPCAEYSAYISAKSLGADPRITACVSFYAIISSCNQATPGFTLLARSSQASCACYLSGGSSFAPQVYDAYLQNCLDYYSTYDTQFYSQTIHGDLITRAPCSIAGNVKNGPTATGPQASAWTPTQTSETVSEALTTSQGQATAKPNHAYAQKGLYHESMLLSLFILPLIAMFLL